MYKSEAIYTSSSKQLRVALNMLRFELTDNNKVEGALKWVDEMASTYNDEVFICLCFRLREAKENNEHDLYNYIEKYVSRLFIANFFQKFYLFFTMEEFLAEFNNIYIKTVPESYWPASCDNLVYQASRYQEIRMLSYQLNILPDISEEALIKRTIHAQLDTVVKNLKEIRDSKDEHPAIEAFNNTYPAS